MLFTLPDPIFIDNGSGRFETFPIYGIELWGERQGVDKLIKESDRVTKMDLHRRRHHSLLSRHSHSPCTIYYAKYQETPPRTDSYRCTYDLFEVLAENSIVDL